MAGDNKNTNPVAVQVQALEEALKAAFKEGRFDVVRKKGEELMKLDPQNRVAAKILEKAMAEEAAALKKANALKVEALESKLDQAFKAGNVPLLTTVLADIQKLDPANKKAKKTQEAIDKAKASLEKGLAKEKVKKLLTEIQFFENKADWNSTVAKANEVLKLEWGNKAAMEAVQKVAKLQKVEPNSLITAKAPVSPTDSSGDVKAKVATMARETGEAVKAKNWVKAVERANEMLSVDWGNPIAVKVLKEVAKAKKMDPAELVTVTAPQDAKKPGFFAKLMGMRAEVPVKPSKPTASTVSTTGKAPSLTPLAPVRPVEEKKPGIQSLIAPIPAKAAPAPVLTPVSVPVSSITKPLTSPSPIKPVAPIAVPLGTPAPKPVVPVAPAAVPLVSISKPMAMPSVAPAVAPKLTPTPTAVPAVAPIQLKVEQKAVAEAGAKRPEAGNIFTQLFGQEANATQQGVAKKPSASVLETIVAQTAPGKGGTEQKGMKAVEVGTGMGFLRFANAFFGLAIVFVLASAAFLWIENMDTQNMVLSRVNLENNAVRLHSASETLDKTAQEEEKVSKEVTKYQGGYQDESREVIGKIVESRMNWTDILKKLNEVTNSVYAKNELSQYVQYNNYAYNADTSQLSVSGTLSDPLGKNLTKLAELETAFKNYPRDPNNPDDKAKPYFYGLQDFRSYTKSFNLPTGRFQSQFSLVLFTKEQAKK